MTDDVADPSKFVFAGRVRKQPSLLDGDLEQSEWTLCERENLARRTSKQAGRRAGKITLDGDAMHQRRFDERRRMVWASTRSAHGLCVSLEQRCTKEKSCASLCRLTCFAHCGGTKEGGERVWVGGQIDSQNSPAESGSERSKRVELNAVLRARISQKAEV